MQIFHCKCDSPSNPIMPGEKNAMKIYRFSTVAIVLSLAIILGVNGVSLQHHSRRNSTRAHYYGRECFDIVVYDHGSGF